MATNSLFVVVMIFPSEEVNPQCSTKNILTSLSKDQYHKSFKSKYSFLRLDTTIPRQH